MNCKAQVISVFLHNVLAVQHRTPVSKPVSIDNILRTPKQTNGTFFHHCSDLEGLSGVGTDQWKISMENWLILRTIRLIGGASDRAV